MVSPDGQYLYFSRRTGTSDLNGGLDDWSVVRRDLHSGVEETLLPDPGGPGKRPFPIQYFRPALSPDGNRLVYATRFEGQTGLRIRDLASGTDRWLAFPIQHDQIQAQSWQDLVPRFAFTRDGSALILSRGGKLEKLPLDGGASTPIPFTAPVDVPLGPLTRVAIKQDTGPVRARLIQTPEQSPDGEELTFSALGHVYVMSLTGSHAKPHRLTSSEEPGFHPSWSPDGRNIVSVTWAAKAAGQVWIAHLEGWRSAPADYMPAAFYTRPVFTPDGKSILVERSNNRGRLNVSMEFGQVRPSAAAGVAPGGRRRAAGLFGAVRGEAAFRSQRVHGLRTDHRPGLTPIDLAHRKHAEPVVEVRGPGWYFMEGTAAVDDSRMSPDGHWLLAQVRPTAARSGGASAEGGRWICLIRVCAIGVSPMWVRISSSGLTAVRPSPGRWDRRFIDGRWRISSSIPRRLRIGRPMRRP